MDVVVNPPKPGEPSYELFIKVFTLLLKMMSYFLSHFNLLNFTLLIINMYNVCTWQEPGYYCTCKDHACYQFEKQ